MLNLEGGIWCCFCISLGRYFVELLYLLILSQVFSVAPVHFKLKAHIWCRKPCLNELQKEYCIKTHSTELLILSQLFGAAPAPFKLKAHIWCRKLCLNELQTLISCCQMNCDVDSTHLKLWLHLNLRLMCGAPVFIKLEAGIILSSLFYKL